MKSRPTQTTVEENKMFVGFFVREGRRFRRESDPRERGKTYQAYAHIL